MLGRQRKLIHGPCPQSAMYIALQLYQIRFISTTPQDRPWCSQQVSSMIPAAQTWLPNPMGFITLFTLD